MKGRANGTSFTKTWAYVTISLIMLLTICLPGCNEKGIKTSAIPSWTNNTGSSSDSAESGGESTDFVFPSTANVTPTIIDMTNRITEMLKVIPDTPNSRFYGVTFTDFYAWNKARGIDTNNYRTKDGDPVKDGENYYIKEAILSQVGSQYNLWIGSWPPFISGMGELIPSLTLQSPIRYANTGYGPLDIERSIIARASLEDLGYYYEAVNGIFDLDAISKTTSAYEGHLYRPQVSIYKGVDFYFWDQDMILDRKHKPPIFDNLGRGRTLAVQQYDIFGSTGAEYVYQMLDASQGQIDSLAKNPEFYKMADMLERMGAMSIVMSDCVLKPDIFRTRIVPSDKQARDLLDLLENAGLNTPVMGPYTAFASGIGMDKRGLFVGLVLIFDSQDTARANISTLENRITMSVNSEHKLWSGDIFPNSLETWVDGRALCVRMRGNITSYWNRLLWGEPLLVRVN
jgi:hypothetical protein